MKSLAEVIAWAMRFGTIVGDGESEIVQVLGPDDIGSGVMPDPHGHS